MAESRWTDALLDPLRLVGDPIGDRPVADLAARGGGLPEVLALQYRLIRHEDLTPEEAPAVLDFFQKTATLPDWADPAQIKRGEAVFERYGPQILMLLACYSLPAAYAARKGVQVLHFTARLAREPLRRLLATTQMVTDVMQEGGLNPGGRAILACQKVRLLHSTIRYQITSQDGSWTAAYGLPINQEDLCGTLTTFSYVVLDGLAKLGITLPPEDQEAYQHVWNVIGFLLGIQPDLLPRNVADAGDLAEAIRRRQFAPSPEGRELLAALVEMMDEATPGTALDGLAATLMRHFLGDEVADMMGVPPANWVRHLAVVGRLLSWSGKEMEDESTAPGRMGTVFAKVYLYGLLWVDRGGTRGQMRIPDKLKQAWKLLPF